MNFDLDVFQAIIALKQGEKFDQEDSVAALQKSLEDRLRNAVNWELVSLIDRNQLRQSEMAPDSGFVGKWDEMAKFPKEVLLEDIPATEEQGETCLYVGTNLATGLMPEFLARIEEALNGVEGRSEVNRKAREVACWIDTMLRSGTFTLHLDDEDIQFDGWRPVLGEH